MRKVVAITYVTLDGVMQSPGAPEEDPRNGFTYGGWIVPYWDETLGKLLERNMAGSFDLLLGRRTYEMLAAHWPNAGDNPVTERFNKATKFVVTRSLAHFDWVNSERIDGDVTEEVRRLKSADGPELQIIGSSELLQTLIAAELIDEFRIWIWSCLRFAPASPRLSLADGAALRAGWTLERLRWRIWITCQSSGGLHPAGRTELRTKL